MTVIHKISRKAEMWKNRSTNIGTINENGEAVIETVIPIPDNEIICDSCNDEIHTDVIMLIYYDDEHAWGAVCGKCKETKFNDVHVIEDMPVATLVVQIINLNRKKFNAYFKYTCHKCGKRVTIPTPNKVPLKYRCDECGYETPIVEGGLLAVSK